MSIFSATSSAKKSKKLVNKSKPVNKDKVPPPLLPVLNTYLANLPTVDKSRRVDCFHPSQISECPRAQILARLGANAANNRFGGVELYQGMMVRIFDNGTAGHERIQGYEKDMGILYGQWFCHYCKNKFPKEQYGSKDMECPHCKNKDYIEYAEIRIDRPDLDLYGKTDGMLTLKGCNFLQEIKTCKKEHYDVITSFCNLHRHSDGRVRLDFSMLDTLVDDIKASGNKRKCTPKDMRDVAALIKKHAEQFGIYLYGTKTRYGILLYENKSNQLMEEILITFTRSMIDPTIAKIKYMQELMKKSKLPNLEECEAEYKCSDCGVRRACSSEETIERLYARYYKEKKKKSTKSSR